MNTKRSSSVLSDIVVLALVLVIGVFSLPTPFHGDQALSTLMAKKMASGELIYRDLWDLKHPGIFLFYLTGGKLFGFNEIGIHTFELLYMLAFSIILIFALKPHFGNRILASFIPLFTVGFYYAISEKWHQTQTESLVGFPLFLSLWYASISFNRVNRRGFYLFLSGLMGGIVLLFKLIFLPLLIIFWLFTAFQYLKIHLHHLKSVIFRFALPIMLGVLIPLLLIFIYFIYNDMLTLVYWTFIDYPAQIMAKVPFRKSTLISGVQWFILSFSPLMAVGAICVYTVTKKPRNTLMCNLLFWVFIGLFIILFQRVSWWQYHYLLLFVPLGILGTKGLDILWSLIKKSELQIHTWMLRCIAIFSLVMLFSPAILATMKKSVRVIKAFPFHEGNIMNYPRKLSIDYRDILLETEFLSHPKSLPGDIYVFGNPLFYYLAERDPAIPLLATWFTPLPELWNRLLALLSETQPPYIFLGKNSLNKIINSMPGIAPSVGKTIPLIEENYTILKESELGTWYVKKR